MSSIARILQYIDFKGINKAKFYKETGLSNGYLDKVKDIGAEKLLSIVSIYNDLSIEWVVTGQGDMIKGKTPVTVANIRKLRTDKKQEMQSIPLYSVSASAGLVDLLSDHRQEHIPSDYISIPNLPKCDGAVPITGDSMYPLLKSGDLALYKEVHDFENIIWGEMYLIAISHKGDDFFFAKYVQKGQKSGYVNLVSHNQNHQSKEFPIDAIKALALIKASVRINTPF